MTYEDIKERVIAYLEDIYLEGDELYESIINNERCVKVLNKSREVLDGSTRKYRIKVYEKTSKNVTSIYLSKGNKICIAFQHQVKIVSNFAEAVDFINSLVNHKVLDLPIIANDLCKKRIKKIFSNEWDGIRRIAARNTGGCPILVIPALGDTLEEHTKMAIKYKLIQVKEEDGGQEI